MCAPSVAQDRARVVEASAGPPSVLALKSLGPDSAEVGEDGQHAPVVLV